MCWKLTGTESTVEQGFDPGLWLGEWLPPVGPRVPPDGLSMGMQGGCWTGPVGQGRRKRRRSSCCAFLLPAPFFWGAISESEKGLGPLGEVSMDWEAVTCR